MKKVLYYLLLMLVMASCRLFKQDVYVGSEYINEEGYKNFYIVDTIIIDNPVRIFTKEGYRFVMSQKSLNSFDGRTSSLFKRSDTFLLDYDFPFDVPFDVYSGYLHKGYSDCSEYFVQLPLKKRGISKIYSYSIEPDYFVLIFIRGDYYNQVYAGLDGPPIIKKNQDRYYKVVVPFCHK